MEPDFKPLPDIPMTPAEIAEERRELAICAVTEVISECFGLDNVPGAWMTSIGTFVDHLGRTDVVAAMQLAVDRRYNDGAIHAFKYFCGICWNKIRSANDWNDADEGDAS